MNKILEGAESALRVVRGEEPAARIVINGHSYVPEASLPNDLGLLLGYLKRIAILTQAGNRNLDALIRDMDQACDLARSSINLLEHR